MDQLARLISILTQLKAKRICTAPYLAEKYDVSIRTIYRDMRKLEKAGVPIISQEGKGYSLLDGYYVAPLQFSEKEANALITAQHIAKTVKDKSFIEDLDSALVKIKSVFKSSILEKAESLHENMEVLDFSYGKSQTKTLAELQLAITHNQLLEINYLKNNEPEASNRKIEPMALYCFENNWVLIAWCRLRKDYRSFRIDRIRSFNPMPNQFEKRKFNLAQYLSQ